MAIPLHPVTTNSTSVRGKASHASPYLLDADWLALGAQVTTAFRATLNEMVSIQAASQMWCFLSQESA